MNTCSNKSSSFKSNLPSRVRHSKGGGGGGGGGEGLVIMACRGRFRP